MGLYSRWALLALTNHTLVRLAAARVGIKDFREYLVLGDDVTIASREVGEEYIRLLNRLGVRVSLAKTVRSSDRRRATEFARQFIVEGEVLSPLPVGLLIEGSVQSLLQLWRSLVGRVSTLDPERIPVLTTLDFGASFPLRGREELKSLWGVYALKEFYTFKDGTDPTEGLLSGPEWLPEDNPLKTVLEATHLEDLLQIDREIVLNIRSQCRKTSAKILEMRWDLSTFSKM